MLDRLFGRGKQDRPAEPTCAACGRTLLPGEWAQTIVHDDGVEEIVCSLCAQAQSYQTDSSDPLTQAYDQAAQTSEWTAPHEAPAQGYDPAPAAPAQAPSAYDHGATFPEQTQPTYNQVATRPDYDQASAAPAHGLHGQDASSVGAVVSNGPAAGMPAAGEPVADWPSRPSQRDESDAFWRALKDKDAEIARLQAEVMRLEAERQELGGQLAQIRQESVVAAPAEQALPPASAWLPDDDLALATPVAPVDARPAAETWATPAAPPMIDEWTTFSADATAELAPVDPAAVEPQEAEVPVQADAAIPPLMVPVQTEETPPEPLEHPAVVAADGAGEMPDPTGADAALPMAAAVLDMPTEPIAVVTPDQAAGEEEWCPACDTAEIPDAALAAPIAASEQGTIQMPVVEGRSAAQIVFETPSEPPDIVPLQRGVDLFNVSGMPKKIAETNELLGLPAIHLSAEGKVMTAVFMWSMAWYEYTVDLDGGDVRLQDRGYDDRTELRPNGTVRSDGTVMLAPLPTRRPVVQSPAAPPPPPPGPPPGEKPDEPGPDPAEEQQGRPPVHGGKGEFISKSLRGQRTDDEAVAWDEMAARDFDWGG